MMRFFLLTIMSFVVAAVSAQDVQQPSIMVIPSDNLLLRLDCLTEVDNEGLTVYNRDYQRAFVQDASLKFVISAINERFAEVGFPLTSLEQTLKGIQTERAMDNVEGLDFDIKSMVLQTARPDIIIDLNYTYVDKGMTGLVTFNIEAVDAYSFLSIASAVNDGNGVETLNKSNLEGILAEQVENELENFQSLIGIHFEDLRANGRLISLRVKSELGVISDFRRDKCGSKPIGRWIKDWLKRNTANGAPQSKKATKTELKYLVRIPLYGEDGYAYSASDFVYTLIDALDSECGMFAIDNTQGLGDAFLLFTE